MESPATESLHLRLLREIVHFSHVLVLFPRANLGAVISAPPQIHPSVAKVLEPIPVCVDAGPVDLATGGVFLKDIKRYSVEELFSVIRDSRRIVQVDAEPVGEREVVKFELTWPGHGSSMLTFDGNPLYRIELGDKRVAYPLAAILKELEPRIMEWYHESTLLFQGMELEQCPTCADLPEDVAVFHQCLFKVNSEQLMIPELRNLGDCRWDVTLGVDGLGYETTWKLLSDFTVNRTLEELWQVRIGQAHTADGSGAAIQSSEDLAAEIEKMDDIFKRRLHMM